MAGGSSSRDCLFAGCSQRHVYNTLTDGSRIYSSYCHDHTCQNPRNERVPFCINPRDPANRFCAWHGKCKAPNCTRPAPRAESTAKASAYLCPNHRCAHASCPNQRLPDDRVCKAHLTCAVRGCPKAPDHPKPFCHHHICAMVPNCLHPAKSIEHGIAHCARHAPCTVVRDCRRLRVTLPSGAQLPNCDEHYLCLRAGTQTGCRPGTLARPRARLCSAHKCSLEGCLDEKDTPRGSAYCAQHTCAKSGCLQTIYHVGNPAARFCGAHECLITGCLASARATGGFCERHGCVNEACRLKRQDGSFWCTDHCCGLLACGHEATHRGGFCANHACKTRGCKATRLGGRKDIALCIDHYTTDVERRAASKAGQQAHRVEADLKGQVEELERENQAWLEREYEKANRVREAERQEQDKRRIRAEAERLRVAEEAARMEEEVRRAELEARVKAEAERLLAREAQRREADEERWAQEARRREVEEERRVQEARRVAAERADARRKREEAEGRAREEAERRAREEAKRRVREETERRAREAAESRVREETERREAAARAARMRGRFDAREADEYRYVPAFDRPGGQRSSWHEEGY